MTSISSLIPFTFVSLAETVDLRRCGQVAYWAGLPYTFGLCVLGSDGSYEGNPTLNNLAPIARSLDTFSKIVGQYVSWLAVFMVLVQFSIVLGRYVFGLGSIAAQETVIYSHGLLFMLGAAYTLQKGGHVRVDIFYAKAGPKRQATIDLLGSLFLLIPVSIIILLASWKYISGSWQIMEGSVENSGLPYVYLLKSVIIVFCGMMILQGVSTILHAILVLGDKEAMPSNEIQTEL
ncbi:TRAP transporter small permease subunit [Sneathiella marina]|uniref:TRAP transporter small permease protein n=1 Tax=Sneathiella marina TaxID=2950108 RepID=A0ABY4VYX1_9PROT|nr:TRAP transporter small permease subunit [Sneathiella marina]USG60125.1 TRAP transporter small permease subunit [Sneathiella marina]